MADKKPAKPVGQPIDPEGFYKVKMRKFTEVANQKFRPSLDYVVKGRVLSEILDNVKSYEPSSLAH